MVLQIILADILLVASIFPRLCGARKNTTQLVKYPRVLSVKPSNKVYSLRIAHIFATRHQSVNYLFTVYYNKTNKKLVLILSFLQIFYEQNARFCSQNASIVFGSKSTRPKSINIYDIYYRTLIKLSQNLLRPIAPGGA